MNELVLAAIISLGINILMFIPAFIYKTDKLTDLSYSITFIVVILSGFINGSKSLAGLLVSLAVVVWALRLGGFLFIRIRRMKRDKRFDEMRSSFFRFGSFWLLQGVSVFVVLIPAVLLAAADSKDFELVSLIGLALWATGLLIEAVADFQKDRFSQMIANKNKWIETGLWKYSRHPNYFGEILVWVGVYVFCIFYLSASDRLLALVSPLYIAGLLLFVSGVPKLEKSADKKWGKNEAYRKYKAKTSVLVPMPKKP